MRVHNLINLKVDLINALKQSEINKGRTNISKNTLRMWGMFVNKLINNKN
jgi:hypothetical protein